jgi:hypothetical protein
VDLGRFRAGSAQSGADLARAVFFWEKPANLFPDLQTLNNHRIFSVNANKVI